MTIHVRKFIVYPLELISTSSLDEVTFPTLSCLDLFSQFLFDFVVHLWKETFPTLYRILHVIHHMMCPQYSACAIVYIVQCVLRNLRAKNDCRSMKDLL